MILRDECHQKDNPIAYFRGNRVSIKAAVEELKSSCREINIWEDIADAPAFEKLNEWMNSSAKKAGEAADKLYNLYANDDRGFLAQFGSGPEAKSLELITAHGREKSITDIELIANSAICVSKFATALNSARKLRDIACILRTLVKIEEDYLRIKSDHNNKSFSRSALEEKLFSKNSERESWKKLPGRAKLVVRAEPSESVSFSSKFLHFHYPGIFFIYDSISSSKTSSKKPELARMFEGFDCYREETREKYKHLLEQCVNRFEIECKKFSGNDEESKERGLVYLKHAYEELILAYYLFDYLQTNRNDDPDCNRLLEELKQSVTIDQGNRSVPCHYTSITRLVDELVMNGDVSDV